MGIGHGKRQSGKGKGQGMRFTLAAEDVAGTADGFSYWREEVCRSFAPLTIERDGGHAFAAKVDVQLAGALSMMDVFGRGYRMERSPRDIAVGPADFYLLFQVLERGIDVEVGDERYAMRAGDVGIGDPNIAWSMRVPEETYRTRNLLIPRQMVDAWLAPGQTVTRHYLQNQPGLQGLIGDYVAGIGRHLPALSMAEAGIALETLGRLIAAAVGFHGDRREAARHALRAARLQQANDLIDRHFRAADLTPDQVAVMLGISLRQLHLLYEPTGESFSQRLQRRRVETCRQALDDPAQDHRTISDIAFDAGFDNLATFYRAFRRRYGMQPSDIRQRRLEQRR